MKNQVLMKADTEINELIMGSELVEECEIWLIIQSNLFKLNFVKSGLLVDEKVMTSPLRNEFKKRIEKGAYYFNIIYNVIKDKFSDCIYVREMNYLHLIIDINLKAYGKTIEVCFKVKLDRLLFVSRHEFIAKNMLEECLEHLDIDRFFRTLLYQFPVLEFFYNLQNGLLNEWDLYDKVENKQYICVIPLAIDEYVITLNAKNFISEPQIAKNVNLITRINVKLSLDSNDLVIVFDKNSLTAFDILHNKCKQFFNDRLKFGEDVLAIKFISAEEIQVYFESVLTLLMSYNQILLAYNFMKHKYKKELESGENRIPKPEITVVLKNDMNTNVLLKTCYFSMHIERKRSKMSFEPVIDLKDNLKLQNQSLILLYNAPIYNQYETFAVFYCFLVELEAQNETAEYVKNFVESYEQVTAEIKPQTMVKLNLFSLINLIDEDKNINPFYFKIVIYDSKNYLKGKIINTGASWRFVMNHIKQNSYPILKQVITKIASTSIKDLYRYMVGYC